MTPTRKDNAGVKGGRGSAPVRVLVVGQTPPPFHGQAVMIEQFLTGHYERIQLFHVRLAFSDDIASVGRATFKKIFVLMATVLRIWFARFRHHTPILYYPPAGPNRVPVLRDLALLCCTRWLFRDVVFHFHAAGVSTYANSLPKALRPLFQMAYGRPALTIRTASQNPEDGKAFAALRDVVIPYGIPDQRGTVSETTTLPGEPLTILYTGALVPSKGVGVLLDAMVLLLQAGANVRLQLMGTWLDADFERQVAAMLARSELGTHVELLGVKSGAEKFAVFAACDIFCFPSYYESESFGLVLIEAMQFAKPVVSTRWRGIPSVVADGRSGFLVEPRNVNAVVERLTQLINDPDLRQQMGNAGRRLFEERFTVQRFRNDMENALAELPARSAP